MNPEQSGEQPARKTVRARRGRGEGAIFYQKKLKRWCAQTSFTVAGTRRRVTVTAASKSKAQERLAELRDKQMTAVITDPDQLTVEKYMESWLKSVESSLAESTAADYRRTVRAHIIKHIGNVHLKKLEPIHVEHMLASMRTRRKSICAPRTRTYVLTILSRALKKAIKLRAIVANPCDAIDRPKKEHREMSVFDGEQSQAFIRAATEDDDHGPLLILAIGTGARRGELFALKWSDVNFTKATLSIRRAHSLIDGRKVVIKEPKTSRSRRQITLPQNCIVALNRQRRLQMARGQAGTEWVFPDFATHTHSPQDLTRAFHKFLKANKLPPIRFHDLRHTHATLLFAAGVHPKIVQERLGHASIAITLDTYSHVIPSMESNVIEELDRLLG